MSTLFHMNVPKSTDFEGPIMNDEKSVTEKCPTQIQFIDLQVRWLGRYCKFGFERS